MFIRSEGRAAWLTRGGWALFAVSTILAASLVRSEPGEGASAAVDRNDEQTTEPATPITEPVLDDPAFAASEPTPAPLTAPSAEPLPGVTDDAVAAGDVLDSSQIWDDTLDDLPPEARRNILSLRDELGSVLPSFDTPTRTASVPPTRAVSDAPRQLPPEPLPWTDPFPDGERLGDDGSLDFEGLRAVRRTIRHNLANLHTPAFRRRIALTTDVIGDETNGKEFADGSVSVLTVRDPTVGPLRPTGRSLDAAIDGAGYFRLTDGNETLHTRAGLFAVGLDRTIRFAPNPDLAVEPTLTLPPGATDPRVTADGTLLCTLVDGSESTVGRLSLDRPASPDLVTDAGPLTVRFTGEVRSGLPGDDGFGSLVPGSIEGSNVDPDEELARLAGVERLLDELGDHSLDPWDADRVAGPGVERY